jgi:hypothetical protein
MLYIANNEEKNWQEHNDIAESIGSNLMSIHSKEENASTRDLAKNAGFRYNHYWLGGERTEYGQQSSQTKCTTDSCWKWSDGSNWDYSVWNNHEPNSYREDGLNAFKSVVGWNDLTKQTYNTSAIYKKQIIDKNLLELPDYGDNYNLVFKSELFNEIMRNDHFEIRFNLNITGSGPRNWRNIFHYGNINSTRMPAMWISWNDPWRMHFITRRRSSTNTQFNFYIPEKYRNYDVPMSMKIQYHKLESGYLLVSYVNDELAGIQQFENEIVLVNGQVFKLKQTSWGYSQSDFDVSNFSIRKARKLQSVELKKIIDDAIYFKDNISEENIEEAMTDNYNSTIQNITTHQNDMNNIITHEKNRLESKKSELDGVLFSQKRELDFNESHRQKHRYYIYMLLVFICCLVAFVIVSRVRQLVTFIPEFIYDLMIIIIIITGGFLIYFAYLEVLRRDHMDFSKLKMGSPNRQSTEERNQARQSAVDSGDLSEIGKLCSGKECCPGGEQYATWNDEIGMCV